MEDSTAQRPPHIFVDLDGSCCHSFRYASIPHPALELWNRPFLLGS